MAATTLELACDVLPAEARVVRARGIEAMNALSRWDIGIVCGDPDLAFDDIIGQPASIRLVDPVEGTSREIGLLIADLSQDDEGRDGHRYTLGLVPSAWALTLRSGYRVFQAKTTKDIVDEVLRDAGIPADQVVWRLAGTYVPRVYCVAYGEAEWSFVERLLADEGISYFFDADDSKPTIVFADDHSSFDSMRDGAALPYEDPGGGLVDTRRFFELERVDAMATTAVHVREYDVRAPEVPIDGRAGEGVLEHYEYPASVLTEAAAETRARVRLEQLQRFMVHAIGASDCIRVQPGRIVQITGAVDEGFDGKYLVVSVEHEVTPGARSEGRTTDYRNRVTLAPFGDRVFRPDLPARCPKVEGIEPALTTGPGGEEIHVDDLGRVKVRFLWDRSGTGDERSSCWVRSLQPNMHGSMVLPRVGWEVPVAYLDGNPDKPVVLGRTYNATQVVPYGLPGGSATTTIQSATSPADGTTNEIRMGDSGGGQEMFIHASRDASVAVGGSATTDVGADETHDVNLTLRHTVEGSQSLSVGASQSVDVGTDYAITVKGSRTEVVGGMEAIKVTANRFVTSSSYTELIGALYGIQCNQSVTSVMGAFTQLVGASLSQQGGLGVSETVLAARTELVGGAKRVQSGRAVSESVMGIKALTAGATRETAGGNVVTDTKVAGSVSVGGSATLKAGGELVIEAPIIQIQAASLDAAALKLSGGKFQTKKGTTKVKAPRIKRAGGGSIK